MGMTRIFESKNAQFAIKARSFSQFSTITVCRLLQGVVTVLTLFCFTLSAPAAITVLDYYRLGEDDPGAFNGGYMMSSTRDSAGTRDLAVSGAPFWSTDVSAAAS